MSKNSEKQTYVVIVDKLLLSCYYAIVMKNIQNKIELAIYGYDTKEFMPIFEDGKLANRTQFVCYKLRALVR